MVPIKNIHSMLVKPFFDNDHGYLSVQPPTLFYPLLGNTFVVLEGFVYVQNDTYILFPMDYRSIGFRDVIEIRCDPCYGIVVKNSLGHSVASRTHPASEQA